MLVRYSRNEEVILPNRYEIKRLRATEVSTGPIAYNAEAERTVHKRIKRKYIDRDNGWPTEWNIAESSRKLIEDLLKEAGKHNVRVFAFIPPINPVLLEYPQAVDEDHTTPEGYDRLVAYLERLEKEFPHFRFEDISNKADHFLPANHFRDTDHLVSAGAAKLTAHIADLLEEAPKPALRVKRDGAQVTLNTDAEDARWLLSDESVLMGAEVNHTFQQPGTYFIGVVGETGERLNGENWTTVDIPESAFPEGEWEHDEDIRPNLVLHDDHQNLPHGIFVNSAGSRDAVIVTWDFGDGNTAAGWMHQHVYGKPGEYTVTMTAYAHTGQTRQVTEKVRVK
jgi:hypothetical protein